MCLVPLYAAGVAPFLTLKAPVLSIYDHFADPKLNKSPPPHPQLVTEVYGSDSNLIYEHNQDYYRKTYFIRTAELWNSMPSEIKSLTSLNLFQNSLFNMYVIKRSTYNTLG